MCVCVCACVCVRACLCLCVHVCIFYVLIPYHIVGKFGGENVLQIYSFQVFGKKVWRINRSANGLSIETTLDGFSLANCRRVAKFTKLSRYMVVPLLSWPK